MSKPAKFEFDIAKAKTSDLIIMMNPEYLMEMMFGPDPDPDDWNVDDAKAEAERAVLLVIAEIDRRFPVPG